MSKRQVKNKDSTHLKFSIRNFIVITVVLQVTDFKMGTELLAMVDHTMKSHALTRGQMQINLRILNLEIDAEFEHQRRGVYTSESIW